MAEDKSSPKSNFAPTLGWLIAMLLPPSTLATLFHKLVTRHLGLAVAAVFLYWIAVVAIRWVGEVAGDLKKEYRPRVVRHLIKRLDQRFSSFEGQYRNYVLGSLRFVEQRGLATLSPHRLELDSVFVDVGLAVSAPWRARGDLLADVPADITERRSLDDLLDRPDPASLVVIGAPGSGKTTLLRRSARLACSGKRRRNIPILLYLRDHASLITAKPQVTIGEILRDSIGELAKREPAGWFEERLISGRCVILLDGLDEVARQDDRRKMGQWIERQKSRFPLNDFVITSRPQGYRSSPLDDVTVLQTRPFTEDQVAVFVHNWYRAVEERITGSDDEHVRRQAEEGANDLLDRLRKSPELYELTVNPLLLTMIANVHRYRDALPGSRADLYSEICQVMLWRRQEAKRLGVNPRGNQKENILRSLAHEMMCRGVRDLPELEVIKILERSIRRVSKDITVEAFLSDVGSNGLLVERENGVYAFCHQTIQEYLTAAFIRERGLVAELADAVSDDWWRETTLLYVADADAGPIIRACLDADTVPAIVLAFDCAEEAKELAVELRDRLDRLLLDIDDPQPSARRRVATAVFVARSLRSTVRTKGGGRICTSPITSRVYQLFERDMQASGRVCRPDSPWPPAEEALDRPVQGIRGVDANAFVEWVNELVGEPSYRLPIGAEIDDKGINDAVGIGDLCVWLHPTEKRQRQWRGDELGWPDELSPDELSAYISADLAGCLPNILLETLYVMIRYLERMCSAKVDKSLMRIVAQEILLRLEDFDQYGKIVVKSDDALNNKLTSARLLFKDLVRDIPRYLESGRLSELIEGYRLVSVRDVTGSGEIGRFANLGFTLTGDDDPYIRLTSVRSGSVPESRLSGSTEDDELSTLKWRIRSELSETCQANVGRAFSGAIAKGGSPERRLLSGAPDPLLSLSTRFRRVVEVWGRQSDEVKPKSYVGSFDDIAGRLREIDDQMVVTGDNQWSPWSIRTMGPLLTSSMDVFERRHSLRPELASTMRLTSLGLAAEAEQVVPDSDLVRQFWNVAVGVSLLQRRLHGPHPPNEVILLSRI
jgi:hypothetical protein